MDGLDCGLFQISLTNDLQFKWECIDFCSIPYEITLKKKIVSAIKGGSTAVNIAHEELGTFFSTISKKFLNGRDIDLISSHGQTIAHVDGVNTLQVGNPDILASSFRVPIVNNVRQADIDAGGNGAPLMPFLDWLLFKDESIDTITINIGGIANISHIPSSGKREDVVGFDTGPGMSLIDECCMYYWEDCMDKDGQLSKDGQIDQNILTDLLKDEFVQKQPPKSTGRNQFGAEYIQKVIQMHPHISPSDLLRTFIAFTAKSIVENMKRLRNFTPDNSRLIISGGGVHHPLIMQDLSQFTGHGKIFNSNKVGINPDMKESLLMAILGVACIKGIPANMPSVTGADMYTILGEIK